jgi:hypothetical protein
MDSGQLLALTVAVTNGPSKERTHAKACDAWQSCSFALFCSSWINLHSGQWLSLLSVTPIPAKLAHALQEA